MAKEKLNTGTSIVDYLKSQGQDSSYGNRNNLANKHGIKNYTGSASQNTSLLNKLKGGSVQSPGNVTKTPVTNQPSKPVTQPGKNTMSSYDMSVQQNIKNAQKDAQSNSLLAMQNSKNSKKEFESGANSIWQNQSDFLNESNKALADYLKQQGDAQYKKQESMYGQALESQLASLEKAYSDAVMRGELSMQEAQEMFEDRKREVEHMAYLDSQATGLEAESRGIGNSQQLLGLMAGDNARKNTLNSDNMRERDRQISDIKTRLSSITTQRDIDISNAQAQHDFGLAGARADIDSQYAQGMFNLQNQTNQMLGNSMYNLGMAGLQHGASLDRDSIQQQYAQSNMAQQNFYNMQNQQAQNQFQELMMDKSFVQDLEKMGVQHGYDLAKMDKQQVHVLEQMAKQFGYDIKKMDRQQKHTLVQMAKQQGYTQQNMATQHGYNKEIGAIQQGYTQQNMATQHGYNQTMANLNHNNSMASYSQKVRDDMTSEKLRYNDAVQRELSKYTPGTAEYNIRKNQIDDNYEQAIMSILAKSEAEARAGMQYGPQPAPSGSSKSKSSNSASYKRAIENATKTSGLLFPNLFPFFR